VPELVARWVEAEEAAVFKKAARADAAGRRKDIPREMPAGAYERRAWIPGREIDRLWDNTRPVERKLTPIQEYIRGRIAGTVPPPEHLPKEPYRDTLPDGIPDPMDFRWDSERQEWVLEPGWWRELPGKGVH
jgi:hypothetical protein